MHPHLAETSCHIFTGNIKASMKTLERRENSSCDNPAVRKVKERIIQTQ